MRILIVEDEVRLAEATKALLKKEGYLVDAVYDGETGLDFALSNIYDIIILDIMLPKMNGFEILKNIRQNKILTQVILLTARDEVNDKIKGLDLGADDYLTKPFDTGELLARLRALSRRRDSMNTILIEYSDVSLNQNTQELCCKNHSIKLGQKEYAMMETLIVNKEQIIPKDILCEKVWGLDDTCEYNNVEVYISFLRKKLARLYSKVKIKVARGVGYILEDKNND